MLIKKNTANKIFKAAWIYFLIVNIAELKIPSELDLIPFIHVSEIPLIKYLPIILAALFLIPPKEFLNPFKDKKILLIIIPVFLLIITGYISSLFASHRQTALGVCNRITYYFAILLMCIAAARYFPGASNFMLKSFIYSNVLVITGSLLDFYVPEFHEFLVKHFGRQETYHSLVRIGDVKIMRPMGFLTDSNLTAFSIAMALLLLLFNYKHFNKIFRYGFYILGTYIFGMLVSRSSLLICVLTIIIFFIFKVVERKELYLFIAMFVIFQLITPQTYGKLYSLFTKKQTETELSSGRLVIWEAAFTVFLESPVIGAGPGNFFELSRNYIRDILKKMPEINIGDPAKAKYHQIDRLNPHNIFLVMLSEIGMVGLIMFLILLILLNKILINEKKYISFLFLFNILIVSSFSNFAPYYKFYLVICIVFYIVSNNNMKLSSTEPVKLKTND
ncbi:MAG: O-antigen ligase family protein [Chlorobi bacterium]|nr:O-antigen ligase family protein [Chlorobiota bacterium]MCI0715143.1 O-antigen ligase family protein [Chlorobiota bacterium]